jgi:hypothetical protein
MGRKLPALYPPAGKYSVREIVTATMLAEQDRQLARRRQEDRHATIFRTLHAARAA